MGMRNLSARSPNTGGMTLHRRFHAVAEPARQAFRRGELSLAELEALLDDALARYPWARPGTERDVLAAIVQRELEGRCAGTRSR